MSIRRSDIKLGSQVFASVIVIGLPIILLSALAISISENGLWLFVIIGLLLEGIRRIFAYQKRKRILFDKYADNEIVSKILKREIWSGQTQEQLLESLGKPHQIDHKLLKKTKREIWKYYRQGKNRYGLRVTVDNGIVIGWDKKST